MPAGNRNAGALLGVCAGMLFCVIILVIVHRFVRKEDTNHWGVGGLKSTLSTGAGKWKGPITTVSPVPRESVDAEAGTQLAGAEAAAALFGPTPSS